VRAADAATLLLALLGCTVLVTGGFRRTIAGVIISVTSATRIFAVAFLVGLARHVAFRRQSPWQRAVDFGRRVMHDVPLPDDDVQAAGAPARRVSPAELAAVTVVMVVLTLVMTYPQIARLDSVRDLGDPLFSIWRLSWIAHQLPRDPLHLFDANIFYPERYTLALSDSIVLPGIAGAPFLWLGVPPVPWYNLYFLATFVLSGLAMYALVRALTGQPPAALLAAVVFAFYPFRFEHYSHFELQFSFWMPLALLALHRTVAGGRWRDGLLTGAAVGGQMLSCMYFGVFLATYIVVIWAATAVGSSRVIASVKPVLAGGGLAILLAAPLAAPYLQVRATVGERQLTEVEYYSAWPSSYLNPHFSRTTYANLFSSGPHEPEKDLFPGVLATLLALVAMWPPLSARRIAYTLGLLLAFEASLGTHGYLFWFLYDYVAPYRGLRVPARFSMLVGLSLAVLAGYGVARCSARLRPSRRYLLAAVFVAVVLFESRATLSFERPYRPHAIYAWFAGLPTSVIAELPVPAPDVSELWRDVRFSYLSTLHWQRMLNGNSGSYPKSYLGFSAAMQAFPDDRSVGLLGDRRVDYVVLHEEFYGREKYRSVVDAIETRQDLQRVTSAVSDGWEARIYRLVK
jgi:hypothetical protein